MKKVAALLLVFCIVFAASLSFAADNPFQPGVDYYQRYCDFRAQTTMLNLGCAKLAVGENLYSADKTTIRKGTTQQLEDWLDEGRLFYMYAKWQYLERTKPHVIDAMLVMTDPQGRFYATYGQWEMEANRAGSVYSWFFDTTDCLRRCRDEADGHLPKGEYAFSMFFNNKAFRVTKVNIV